MEFFEFGLEIKTLQVRRTTRHAQMNDAPRFHWKLCRTDGSLPAGSGGWGFEQNAIWCDEGPATQLFVGANLVEGLPQDHELDLECPGSATP